MAQVLYSLLAQNGFWIGLVCINIAGNDIAENICL